MAPSESKRRSKAVRILAAVLVVVGCVLAPIAVLGVWARNTLLDTDEYVGTVGPLAENEAIQRAVADRVTERLSAAVNLENRVAEALPARAAFVAPFVADGVERFVHGASLRFLESDRFHNLWRSANRKAHRQVLAVLEGRGTDTVRTRDGQVGVDLRPVVDRVRRELDERGIDVFGRRVDEVRTEFVLFDSEGLRSAQSGVRLLRKVTFVLPIASLLLIGSGIVLSANRRRTLVRAALGVALAMALVLIGANLGRDLYLDAIEGAARSRDAAAAAFDQVLRYLLLALRTTFVLGVVVAIGAWLAGPGQVAKRIRALVGRLAERGAGGRSTAFRKFVSVHRVPLRVLVVGTGLVVLVMSSHPGPVAVVLIAVLVAVGLLLVELFGRVASEA